MSIVPKAFYRFHRNDNQNSNTPFLKKKLSWFENLHGCKEPRKDKTVSKKNKKEDTVLTLKEITAGWKTRIICMRKEIMVKSVSWRSQDWVEEVGAGVDLRRGVESSSAPSGRKMLEQDRERCGRWTQEGKSGGLGCGWSESAHRGVVKYKWKAREKWGCGEPRRRWWACGHGRWDPSVCSWWGGGGGAWQRRTDRSSEFF